MSTDKKLTFKVQHKFKIETIFMFLREFLYKCKFTFLKVNFNLSVKSLGLMPPRNCGNILSKRLTVINNKTEYD